MALPSSHEKWHTRGGAGQYRSQFSIALSRLPRLRVQNRLCRADDLLNNIGGSLRTIGSGNCIAHAGCSLRVSRLLQHFVNERLEAVGRERAQLQEVACPGPTYARRYAELIEIERNSHQRHAGRQTLERRIQARVCDR